MQEKIPLKNYGTYRPKIPLSTNLKLKNTFSPPVIKIKKPQRNLMDFTPVTFDKFPFDYEERIPENHLK